MAFKRVMDGSISQSDISIGHMEILASFERYLVEFEKVYRPCEYGNGLARPNTPC